MQQHARTAQIAVVQGQRGQSIQNHSVAQRRQMVQRCHGRRNCGARMRQGRGDVCRAPATGGGEQLEAMQNT